MTPISKALSWDDLRLVTSIGESGGLAAAAAALGVTHSTVSRRLAVVEQTLGVALFDRRRSGYVPTSAGLEVIELGGRMEVDVLSLTRRLTGQEQTHSGELRITTSDVLLQDFLAPVIVAFQRDNPEIRIEVVVTNTHLNLARGEADIAFRATRAPPENLYGRKLAGIAWAAYGARTRYIGRNLSRSELFDENWVTFEGELGKLHANAIVRDNVPPTKIVFRANTVAGVRSAVCAGAGVGYLPCTHGDSHPGLVRVSAVETEAHDDLWVLTHPDIRRSYRVNAFMTHCINAIVKLKPMLEGKMKYSGW